MLHIVSFSFSTPHECMFDKEEQEIECCCCRRKGVFCIERRFFFVMELDVMWAIILFLSAAHIIFHLLVSRKIKYFNDFLLVDQNNNNDPYLSHIFFNYSSIFLMKADKCSKII